MIARAVCGVVALTIHASASACPADATPRAAATVLSLQRPGQATLSFGPADLAALPQTALTQRQTVSSTGGASIDRSVVYSGVLLRDALAQSGFAASADRGARTAVIEAVATDGYRAVFSWGELFNSGRGEQVLLVRAQDGQALDAAAGPLALRSLADLRPGPRHVRNLCALVVRSL